MKPTDHETAAKKASPVPLKPAVAYELVRIAEERTRTLEYELRRLGPLLESAEGRIHALETALQQMGKLVEIVEERTRTLEYLSSENLYSSRYQADLLQKMASDAARARGETAEPWFRARDIVELHTKNPIALGSNDHIHPDSTTEGLTRPTLFVRHCIEKLGSHIRCLDLGTGAAGLVYEFARNEVFAIGIDGSDFNARYRIGYWPFIPDNLFTCDLTKPFRFTRRETGTLVGFDVISAWEVLEHIESSDLTGLFSNIREHLLPDGYFLGSISLLEYRASDGTPYHVTLKPREWWAERMLENGLLLLDEHPFDTGFFCRGIGGRFQDVHNYFSHPATGFHFVAKRLSPPLPV